MAAPSLTRRRTAARLGLALAAGLAAAPQAGHAATQEEAFCQVMRYQCRKDVTRADGRAVILDPARRASCRAMKNQGASLGYGCAGGRKRVKRDPIAACRKYDQMVEPGAAPWVAFSYDTKNPMVNGWCERPGAEDARQCAAQACRARGGTQCSAPCDASSGRKLRVCRATFITLVVSPEYARMGCGARYLTKYGGTGKWTRETYIKRELLRCGEASKKMPICNVIKTWE